MNYVGVGRRAVAIIIDAVVGFVLAIPISILTGDFSTTPRAIPGQPVSKGFYFQLGSAGTLLLIVVWLAYMTIAEANGASLGKLATGIRVRKEDGSRMDFQASLVRNLLRLIDGLFAYLVGAILVWTSPRRQRLGDRAAHTVVVPKEFVGMVQAGDPAAMPPTPSGPPAVPPPPPGP
ncbi:MAG TPA: RDD family protein [Actinomycetota bacterium]